MVAFKWYDQTISWCSIFSKHSIFTYFASYIIVSNHEIHGLRTRTEKNYINWELIWVIIAFGHSQSMKNYHLYDACIASASKQFSNKHSTFDIFANRINNNIGSISKRNQLMWKKNHYRCYVVFHAFLWQLNIQIQSHYCLQKIQLEIFKNQIKTGRLDSNSKRRIYSNFSANLIWIFLLKTSSCFENIVFTLWCHENCTRLTFVML